MVHQSQARADRFSVCCQDEEEEASIRKKHDTHNKSFHTSIHAQFRIKVTHLIKRQPEPSLAKSQTLRPVVLFMS